MLELGGLGGDEVCGFGVDVVEVGVVVVVVVHVVHRHLLDAGGDAPHRLHVRLGGAPPPVPLPSLRPPPMAPMPRPVCPRRPTAPLPLPLGPFPAPTPLSPCPCRGSRSLSPAPWPALPAPMPFPCPCPCPWLRPRLLTVPRCAPCATWPPALAPCSRPCAFFPCRGPFPASCPASRRPLPVLCPAPLPLASSPCPCFCPRSLQRVPSPAPCVCPWALSLSPPVPRSALPWLAPCPACVRPPPSRITHRAPCCRCSCGSVTPGGERSGAWGRMCRVRPVTKAAMGGKLLGGPCVGVALVGVGAVSRAPPATRCGYSGSRRGARGPRGVRPARPRRAGGRGVAGGNGGGARRGCGLNSLCTLPAPLCGRGSPQQGARGLRRGHLSRWRRARGRGLGRGAACWGCGLSPLCAWGPLPRRGGRACCLGGGAGHLTGAGPWIDNPVLAEAARGCPACCATGTAASASLRISNETGDRERDRRWWRSSR